tara:strand:+ start:334 stop:678 length:345 start_codon:yes stop_codon:yes gene_type:complete
MNDTIRIHELEIQTHIGVPDEERKEAQKLLVSVELQKDVSSAAEDDDLSSSIDYEKVAESIQDLAKTERKTLERFAEDASDMILDDFKPEHVTVTVQKFPLEDAQSVSITITRP